MKNWQISRVEDYESRELAAEEEEEAGTARSRTGSATVRSRTGTVIKRQLAPQRSMEDGGWRSLGIGFEITMKAWG